MQEYHKYDAPDLDYLDSLGYEKIISEAQQDLYIIHATNQFSTLNSSLDCRTDSDIDPMQPLCIGMDYNANINWIVCGQPRNNRLNILKSFYIKFERKIPALVADCCTYYAPHPNKTVIYYYDATALGSNYAVNDQDFHWVVVHEFERHGWQVIDVYLGNPMRHDEKYLLINQGFAGKQRLMPYFNRQNNGILKPIYENTEMTVFLNVFMGVVIICTVVIFISDAKKIICIYIKWYQSILSPM